ncbi:uncharacterized protein [Euphorbia lathyris]|uniref:uncharacterized protein n=1 Tax=Euphorbia lathyris TaxID=212925 RepID=UPI003313F38A
METIVKSRQEFMVSPNANANAKPFLRTSHFLTPSLTSNHESISALSFPSLPPTFDPKFCPFIVNFHGWRNPSKNWNQWVHKMASLHAPTWKKAGIYQAILFSTYEIHRNNDLIFGITERWCPDTKSFIFPWGEATITLEDMLIAGYSVLGSPVFEPLETKEFMAVQEVLVRERKKVSTTPARKASQSTWLKVFMDSGSEVEHEAFLSFWLSRFVLPNSRDLIRQSVFPIAIHLARGNRIALAPAVLATIYRDLTLLKQMIVSLTALNDEKVVVTTFAPFQLVLVWVWERFVKLSPKPKLLKIGEPRFAQWNNVKCSVKNVRSLLDSSKESFNWRPYTKPLENWDFPNFYREKEMWVFSDSDLDDDLLSFILCLRVSDLVGLELKCTQQYLPHRVARQFGFDQDLPGFVVQSGASSEDAWSSYIRPVGDVKCFIPSRLFMNDVTTRYLDWWNTLEFHNHSNVLKEKKKAEASLDRGDKRADGDYRPLKSWKIKIEENENLSVPPGFPPKRDIIHIEDSDSSEEDNHPIAKILKLKKEEDVSSVKQCGNGKNLSTKADIDTEILNRECGNWNNLSGTPEGHTAGQMKSNDVGVELGECESDSSSVAGNDKNANDLEIKEAKMEENVKVKEKEDVESVNECVTASLGDYDYEKKKMNEAAFMGLESRVERLEKMMAARKALL